MLTWPVRPWARRGKWVPGSEGAQGSGPVPSPEGRVQTSQVPYRTLTARVSCLLRAVVLMAKYSLLATTKVLRPEVTMT